MSAISDSPIIDPKSRFHPVYSRAGMVVSQEVIASRIGADILALGGNAVDAAVATGFALAVTLPRAGNLAGGGFMLIHLTKRNETIALDFREVAPAQASRDMFLDLNGGQYHYLFWGMGLAAFFASVALFLMPSSEVQPSRPGSNIFGGLTFIWKDRLFGRMLFGWMLMGLGVIMTIPLRIEYMVGNGGIGITNREVAIIVVVYSFAGVLTSRAWGKLFDRVSFVPYRISLNIFLFSSVLIFFLSTNFWGLLIGSTLAGVANGGASIAWSLWVTKLAPSGLEAEYMSAHVFMTGVRGACAPFVGYSILGILGFEGMAYFSCSLIFVSGLIFFTVVKSPRLMV